MLYRIAERLLEPGYSFVIESNFDPGPPTDELRRLHRSYPFRAIQVRCVADGTALVHRFEERARTNRHPGHADSGNMDEMRDRLLQGTIPPLDLPGTVITVDTTDWTAFDYDSLLADLRSLITPQGGHRLTMRLRGLIFDLDGTIADTIPVCCAAFRDALHELTGEEHRDEQIVALFGPSEEGIFQRLLGGHWQEAHGAFLTAYEARHDTCAAPFPGIEAALESLKERGIELAIVTGKGAGSAEISVRRLGLARYFDIIESGSPDGIVKAAAIEDLLARWNLPPEEVAYVGDSAYDMIDARKTGVVALAAGWAATADLDALRATEPDEIFTTVDAFSNWIEDQTDAR